MAFDLEHLTDLALFARVVEARSFTGAAELSGIAKSAVSRRISLLEQRLGVQLLRRTTRSLNLPVRGNLWASDGTVLRQAALSGLGLVVVPSFMVAEDMAKGQLEEVLTGARRATIGIYAVVSKTRGLPHRTKTLVDFLCRWFRSVDWATPV